METPFIDIHTHGHREGVKVLLNYSLGIDSAPSIDMEFTSGIHPWCAEDQRVTQWISYLDTAPIVAVGEIGLDYVREVDRARQEEVFRIQLELAQRRKLPVVIHCVRAQNDALRLLAEFSLVNVLFHSYIGNRQMLEQILYRGYYFSISPMSLRSSRLIAALKRVDREILLSRIFVETDSIAEVAIENIYSEVADILAVNVDYLKLKITQNYARIWH